MEEDPFEILESVKLCLDKAVENLTELGIDPADIKGKDMAADRVGPVDLWRNAQSTVLTEKTCGCCAVERRSLKR